MTERKPPQMSFRSWIDQQIADAEKRGVFDDLPGAGKPLNIRPSDPGGDYGAAWVRNYARREGVPASEFLPAPLRLRREAEALAEAVADFGSEQEVREAAAELNRRIVEWRRIPLGPPVHVRLVNADDLAARWRATRPAARAPAGSGGAAGGERAPDAAARPGPSPGGQRARGARRPWWRRRRGTRTG